jgi:hypothetical protein
VLVFSELLWTCVLNICTQSTVKVLSKVSEGAGCCKGVKENHVTLALLKKTECLDNPVYPLVQHLLSPDDAGLLEIYPD